MCCIYFGDVRESTHARQRDRDMKPKKKTSPSRASIAGSLPGASTKRVRAFYQQPQPTWNAPHLEVILTRGKTAKIDPEDYAKVRAKGPWSVWKKGRTFYAHSAKLGWGVSMHRLIMGFPKYPEFEVDHKNGDGLDNRKQNLRVVTHAVNMANRRGSAARAAFTDRPRTVKWGAR